MKKLYALVFALICCFLMSACSSASNAGTSSSVERSQTTQDSGVLSEDADAISDGIKVEDNRKIIEYITLTLQTKEFDSLMEKIQQQLSQYGGYVESSEISGNGYSHSGYRSAVMVLRIPSENSDAFSLYLSENSAVTQQEIYTEDVTLNYVDMESRISALKIEKESLESLLEKADSLTDLFAVQERLTDVIYEIESYESQLRTYDNLIDYTTLTLNIFELEQTVVPAGQSIWQQIGTNLSNNMRDIGNFFTMAFVYAASSLPYLVILAVIAVIVIVIIKLAKGKKKKNESFYPTPQTTVPQPSDLPQASASNQHVSHTDQQQK